VDRLILCGDHLGCELRQIDWRTLRLIDPLAYRHERQRHFYVRARQQFHELRLLRRTDHRLGAERLQGRRGPAIGSTSPREP
jgi:hypothetical protein